MTKSAPKWINFAPISVENDIFVTDQKQPVNLPTLIREIESQYTMEALNKKIDLIFDFEPSKSHEFEAENMYTVKANPADLRFMISQLLKNSLAQTLEGFIKIRLSKFEQMFAIEVEDSGMGVHPDEKISFVESMYRGNLCRITYVQDPKINMTKIAPYLESYDASMQLLINPGKGMTRRLLLPANIQINSNKPAVKEFAIAY
ncbi:MAG: hypothetical protein AAGD96_23130 [Chloroflexota bacterium]